MKYGFLPILGLYSPGIYLITTHSRNKLLCFYGFDMELLFAENQPKITEIGATQQSTKGESTNLHCTVMLFGYPFMHNASFIWIQAFLSSN